MDVLSSCQKLHICSRTLGLKTIVAEKAKWKCLKVYLLQDTKSEKYHLLDETREYHSQSMCASKGCRNSVISIMCLFNLMVWHLQRISWIMADDNRLLGTELSGFTLTHLTSLIEKKLLKWKCPCSIIQYSGLINRKWRIPSQDKEKKHSCFTINTQSWNSN